MIGEVFMMIKNVELTSDIQRDYVQMVHKIPKLTVKEEKSLFEGYYNSKDSHLKDENSMLEFSYEGKSFHFDKNDISSYEFMAVCKEILKPSYYLVLYYRYFCLDPKSLSFIAHMFFSTRQNISVLIERAFYVLKPYLNCSKEYLRVLECLMSKEGDNFKYLNVHPIDPKDIVRFWYAYPYLNLKEREVLREHLLGKYDVLTFPLYQLLEMSKKEYSVCLNSLQEKLEVIFSDYQKYYKQEELCIRAYKTKIYNMDFNDKSCFFDDDIKRRLTL